MLDLAKAPKSSDETCDVDSPTLVLMTSMMSIRGNNNEFNGNGSQNPFFYYKKDHVIPKDDCTALNPEIKEFWKSAPNKEKFSILRSARDNNLVDIKSNIHKIFTACSSGICAPQVFSAEKSGCHIFSCALSWDKTFENMGKLRDVGVARCLIKKIIFPAIVRVEDIRIRP